MSKKVRHHNEIKKRVFWTKLEFLKSKDRTFTDLFACAVLSDIIAGVDELACTGD